MRIGLNSCEEAIELSESIGNGVAEVDLVIGVSKGILEGESMVALGGVVFNEDVVLVVLNIEPILTPPVLLLRVVDRTVHTHFHSFLENAVTVHLGNKLSNTKFRMFRVTVDFGTVLLTLKKNHSQNPFEFMSFCRIKS